MRIPFDEISRGDRLWVSGQLNLGITSGFSGTTSGTSGLHFMDSLTILDGVFIPVRIPQPKSVSVIEVTAETAPIHGRKQVVDHVYPASTRRICEIRNV
jgi:hypothetical protein